jgi:L-alanine-DL-glutamate epimerase-like enolase superfamily enzyme
MRPKVVGAVETGAGPHRRQPLGEPLHERVVDAGVDVEPVGGGAGGAAVAHLGRERAVDGLIQVGDIALWDAAGKRHDTPLYRLLGGTRDSIPAYGSGLNLHLDGDELTEARKTIGPSVRLFLDANQKWTGADAVRRTRALEQFDPSWLEEPGSADDPAGNALVRAKVSTPIALGESLYSRFQVAEYLRAGAVDILQPDIALVGGFTEWMRVAALASGHGVPMAPHAPRRDGEFEGAPACRYPDPRLEI